MSHEAIKSVVNEVAVSKVLDHPNILKILIAYHDDQHIYIVQENFVPMGLIDVLTQHKRLKEMHVTLIMEQVMKVIAYCHSENLVHCDIRPENIFISHREGRHFDVKIGNFGNAVLLSPGRKLSDYRL